MRASKTRWARRTCLAYAVLAARSVAPERSNSRRTSVVPTSLTLHEEPAWTLVQVAPTSCGGVPCPACSTFVDSWRKDHAESTSTSFGASCIPPV